MFFLLLIAISSGHFLHKSGHKYLQEAGLTTMIGIVAGYGLKLMSVQATMEHIAGHFVNLFMLLLLPPIIFESGYNMQKKPFFRNVGSVMAYSFLGTFIAIIFSSMMFWVCGQLGWSYPFTMRDSWAFGSLISATDPVAVLAIFKQMDADENLYAIVFGESIFNDAISIVMYDTVRKMADSEEGASVPQQVLGATINFLVIFIGSILMGAMTALIVAFIQKRQTSYSESSLQEEDIPEAIKTLRQKNYEDE